MNIKNFYNSNKSITIFSLIALIISILLLAIIFFQSIFYDQFIWKYFWGPIVSDALGYSATYNGVIAEEKFTLISEIIYGFLIIIVLIGLYKLMKRWNILVNFNFLLAIMPYIIAGSFTRVLEDSEFFIQPLVYLFITPIIYFQILLLFLFFLIIGFYIKNRFKNSYLTINSTLFVGGIIYLIPFFYYTYQGFIDSKLNLGYNVRFDVFILIIFLVLVIIFSVFLISKLLKKYQFFHIFSKPLNLAMISGHMIDGISSYISIYDPLKMGLPSYYEKHPASDFIMDIWPPLFPIIKFALIIIVIILFDIIYKKDFEKYPRLVNLLKIGIFILGFAPGLRDLLRVMIGV
jgi:uncharacterized membrane protein